MCQYLSFTFALTLPICQMQSLFLGGFFFISFPTDSYDLLNLWSVAFIEEASLVESILFLASTTLDTYE